MIRKRTERIEYLVKCAVPLAIMLAGCVFLLSIGHPIPCLFHKVTGLSCPGCGITRMFLALLRGDLRGAAAYNAGALLLLPVVGIVEAVKAVRFLKTGERRDTKTEKAVLIGCAAALLLFGVVRNFPVYPYPLP